VPGRRQSGWRRTAGDHLLKPARFRRRWISIGLLLCAALAAHGDPQCPIESVATSPPNPCDQYASTSGKVIPLNVAIPSDANRVPGAFLVSLRGPRTKDSIGSLESDHVLELLRRHAIGGDSVRVHQIPYTHILLVTADRVASYEATSRTLRELAEMRNEDGSYVFASVEALSKIQMAADPHDPKFPSQWGLPKISATEAWTRVSPPSGAPAVVVAIVDSGVYREKADPHGTAVPPYYFGDLVGRLWPDPMLTPPDNVAGTNFTTNPPDANTDDAVGHGTNVAGIMDAATNNTDTTGNFEGIAGTAGEAPVAMLPLKVFDLAPNENPQDVTTDVGEVVSAIGYARAKHVSIINLSLGSSNASYELCNAISQARDDGILVVVAAGNLGDDVDLDPSNRYFPASYELDNILAVMATDQQDQPIKLGPLRKSNYGCKSIDIAAPGIDITTTAAATDSYVSVMGTSMAAPFVSGAAALVRLVNPSWTPQQVRAHLMDSADRIEAPTFAATLQNASHGRLNMDRALTSPFEWVNVPTQWVAGVASTVTWKKNYDSRACPTFYLHLFTDGSALSDDDTCNGSCISVQQFPASTATTTLQITPSGSSNNVRLRIGCVGSRLWDDSSPFTIAGGSAQDIPDAPNGLKVE
jgi:subtilisin family serine protease